MPKSQRLTWRDLRWHAVQALDRRNVAGLPALLLLSASAALAYVVIWREQPQAAELQAELKRMRSELTLGNIRAPSGNEPPSLVSAPQVAPSNLFADVSAAARSAGLSAIGVSAEAAASNDAERVSLKARGTYAQSKAFLASLLNDTKVIVTQLELRASEPGQVDVRIAIIQSASKVE